MDAGLAQFAFVFGWPVVTVRAFDGRLWLRFGFRLTVNNAQTFRARTERSSLSRAQILSLQGDILKILMWTQNQELLDSPVLNIRAVEVFVLIKGRNAWHSTWSMKYRGPGALYASLGDAKEAAEEQRGRGNVFYIREVPALVMESAIGAVVQVEFHSTKTFSRWNSKTNLDKLITAKTMRGALRRLVRSESNWLRPIPDNSSFVQALCPIDTELSSLKLRRIFHEHKSRPEGVGYRLGWDQSIHQYDWVALRKICTEFNQQDEAVLTSKRHALDEAKILHIKLKELEQEKLRARREERRKNRLIQAPAVKDDDVAFDSGLITALKILAESKSKAAPVDNVINLDSRRK